MDQQNMQVPPRGGSNKKPIIAVLIIVLVAALVVIAVMQNKQQMAKPASTAQTAAVGCDPKTVYTDYAKATQDFQGTCGLNLAGKEMINLPPNLSSFGGIKQLDLSYNNLNVASSSLAGLAGSLTYLNLSNNHLAFVPVGVESLYKLTYLNLSNNYLSVLPASFSNLSALTQLNLSNNQFASVPDVVLQMSALVELNLSGNPITQLPDLTKLQNLGIVDVVGTKIPAATLATLKTQYPRIQFFAQ